MSGILHITGPEGQQIIRANKETEPPRLADLLKQRGFALNTRCNGRVCCKGCSVRLDNGQLRDTASGHSITGPCEILSCKADWIDGMETSITIPSRSLLALRPSITDDFRMRVSVGRQPLFSKEFGLAIDIGTTTVAIILVELGTGRILARASGFNQQILLGDDVLSRIQLCQSEPEMACRLQDAVWEKTIFPLALEACTKAGIDFQQVGGMTIAGNTTMLHLLLGVDPSPMGVAPFTADFLEHRETRLHELRFCDIPDMQVHLLPGIAAYVGADIVGGIFTTGLYTDSEPALFVDIGTNGEMALRHGDHLYACATAAGPAFEGCGLSCGMRAAEAAIQGLEITQTHGGSLVIGVKTIGALPPSKALGICGSAYVDFLAQGRSSGLLLESGRFDSNVIARNPSLFRHSDSGRALMLCGEKNLACVISEADIALLLQAKAAIAAGIQTLLRRRSLAAADLRTLYLAGGFGMHLNVANAIACGLLPGFSPEQVEVVGNTSLGGAYLAMLDETVLAELECIRAQADVVELNLDPEFEDTYIENLSLI